MVLVDVDVDVEELNDEERDEVEDEVDKELVFVLDLVTRLALVVVEDKESERSDAERLEVGVKEVDDGVGCDELINGREVIVEE